MFCPYCGNQVSDTARFCSSCGSELPMLAQPAAAAAPQQPVQQAAQPAMQQPVQQAVQSTVQQPAQPATQSTVQQPQPQTGGGLPPDVFYDDRGNLVWICRVLEDPEKLAAIAEATGQKPKPLWQRGEFTSSCLDCYLREGRNERAAASPKKFSKMELLGDIADLVLSDAMSDSNVSDYIGDSRDDVMPEFADSFAYRKMKEIRPARAEGKIYLKCGFKNDSVQVAPEQLDFVVAELSRRCPQAQVV